MQRCEPDYIEVKAYIHVGFSRKRLIREATPDHDEVVAFASKIGDEIGYQIANGVSISRVVLLLRDGGAERIVRCTR